MIPVQNIYYMLAYAFQVLNENGYKNIETEQFDNVGELCAAILSKGVSLQLKEVLARSMFLRQSLCHRCEVKLILPSR